MKKLLFSLSIILLFSSCIKRSSKTETVSRALTPQKVGSATFNDDVEEFVLEDDNDKNIFEEASIEEIDELDLEDISYDDYDNEVVQFEFDSTEVNPHEKEKIKRNIDHVKNTLKKDPNAKVVVDGHSCKIARSQSYNYMISQERANKVAKEYIAQGVPADKVKPVGHGDSKRITDADGRDVQSINRRAETRIVKP